MSETESAWHVRRALLPDGWSENVRIGIASGRIASIEPGAEPLCSDHPIAIGLPGMANLHSHAFQRGMAGLTEIRGPASDSFWTWREVMYRFVGRLTPDAVRAIAAFAYMEMLEAGFIRVGEFHYLHHDPDGRRYANIAEMGTQIAEAAASAGIGLTLLPVFYAHSGFGGAAPTDAQRRFLCDVDSYAHLIDASRAALSAQPDALVGVAPHSLRAATPDELHAITAISEGPVHIHIAEQEKEVADCIAWSGARPVEWLLAHADVDKRWCLVHATHIDDREMQGLATSGAVAGLCPITEANLGDGLFPAEAFLARGGVFGIGSDSNVRIDMSEELRLLEYGRRLADRSRNVLAGAAGASTGRTLFDAAVTGGAQALGVTGGLKVGASADLIAIDAHAPALAGRTGDEIVATLVFGGSQHVIAEVWRGGRRVVSAGRHIARDSIGESYRSAMTALMRS